MLSIVGVGLAICAIAAGLSSPSVAVSTPSIQVTAMLRTDGSLFYDGQVYVLKSNGGYHMVLMEASNTSLSTTNDTEGGAGAGEIACSSENHVKFPSALFWTYLFVSVLCVATGGIMSGLTIGLFSIDPLKLALLYQDKTSSEIDKMRARKLTPILAKHHHLLVSLLVMNAAAMEALPIFLDALVPSYAAILISVVFVLFFGEIIPQAIFAKNALQIGAFLSPLVRVVMIITIPVSWPVSKLLDCLLGEEGGSHFYYQRSELTALVELHSHDGILNTDQVQIMKGAIQFADRKVRDIMTSIKEVYMLEAHKRLDFETMEEIFKSGYSRIPVYNSEVQSGDNIMGLLIVKDMILINPEDRIPIITVLKLYGRPVTKVFPDCPVVELLATFKTGKSHMAIVYDVNNEGPGDPFYYNVGLVTLEDVIEDIIQSKIADETEVEQKKRFNILTLDSRRKLPNMLTPQETVAVFHHLTGSVAFFSQPSSLLSAANLRQLLSFSRVIQVVIDPEHKPDPELRKVDVGDGGLAVYRHGVPSQYFTLVLDGNLEVQAGAEGFISEAGRWTPLYSRVLQISEEQAKTGEIPVELTNVAPDFSAFVVKTARLLRISRADFVHKVRIEHGFEKEEAPPVHSGRLHSILHHHDSHKARLSISQDKRHHDGSGGNGGSGSGGSGGSSGSGLNDRHGRSGSGLNDGHGRSGSGLNDGHGRSGSGLNGGRARSGSDVSGGGDVVRIVIAQHDPPSRKESTSRNASDGKLSPSSVMSGNNKILSRPSAHHVSSLQAFRSGLDLNHGPETIPLQHLGDRHVLSAGLVPSPESTIATKSPAIALEPLRPLSVPTHVPRHSTSTTTTATATTHSGASGVVPSQKPAHASPVSERQEEGGQEQDRMIGRKPAQGSGDQDSVTASSKLNPHHSDSD